MNRLNLDAFKAQANTKKIEELEMLTGGILGACHCQCENKGKEHLCPTSGGGVND